VRRVPTLAMAFLFSFTSALGAQSINASLKGRVTDLSNFKTEA
jgi:hypothetical protein